MNKNIAKLYLALVVLTFVTFAPVEFIMTLFSFLFALGIFLSIVFCIVYLLSN